MSNLSCKSLIEKVRGFSVGIPFFIGQTIVASLFVITGTEVIGVVFFSVLICLFLVVCKDVLSTTLPFLLTCTIATNCYNSYHIFMPMAKYAPIVIASLLFHFIAYRKKITFGESGKGIIAVSIAVVMGGIGRFTFMDYFYGTYYILGLGFGMFLAYLLMRSEFFEEKDYDMPTKFSWIMILMAVVCSIMIATGYCRYWIGTIPRLYPEGFSRNNLSTLLMFSMPFPLIFAEKRRFSIAFSVLIYASISATTSRGGLLFGGIEVFVCFAFWIFSTKGNERKKRLFITLSLLVVLLLAFGKIIYGVVTERLLNGEEFRKDARRIMFLQALDRFSKSPFSGYGILDRTIEYEIIRKKGALTWYHMMFPQIIGSMGLIGVLAYGYQCIGRVRLIFQDKNVWSIVLGISYLGILLMSQVNPGEFCPLPFELLTVLLFVLQEKRLIKGENAHILNHA